MADLSDNFYNWLKDNQSRSCLTDDEIQELVDTLEYMIDDACVGWEYDYQYDIKLDLRRRIEIINEFDDSLLKW